MKIQTFAFVTLAAGLALAADEAGSTPARLVAHEWGTFTSVADLNGNPVRWFAVGGPAPLPCFVHRGSLGKDQMSAKVRMETPVVYFYPSRRMSVDLDVTFRGGLMTEWYPKADSSASSLSWKVDALPGEKLEFPTGAQRNDYYAARATDAAPLRAGNEQEKLLFYRGIGDMDVPVRPRFTPEGRLRLEVTTDVPAVFVFESRGGKTGFRTVGALHGTIDVEAPVLSGDSSGVQKDLENALVAAGLYAKEAAAMLATWRETWFEDGMRVFYVAPASMVEKSLPMRITPKPESLQRVFVGRIEVLSPATQKDIASGDRTVREKYDRFMYPFWDAMKAAGKVSGLIPGVSANVGACTN